MMMCVGLVLFAIYGSPHVHRLQTPVQVENGRQMQGLVMRRRNPNGTWAFRDLTPDELEDVHERMIW
jgi:hypothetical protein